MVQEQLAGVGEPRAGLMPLEKLDPELALKLLHLPRDCRLGDAERGGSSAEAQVVGYRDETFELAEIHVCVLLSLFFGGAGSAYAAALTTGTHSAWPLRPPAPRTRAELQRGSPTPAG